MQRVFVEELGSEVCAPDTWSYTAVRIFADKYLAKDDNNDIFKALGRVADGVSAGDTTLATDLYIGMLDQRFAFNSPVYFNVGVEVSPQCSACFIQSVEDNLDSILDLSKKEGLLFQFGSGTGTNLSPLRGSDEPLSKGGKASGPVSFMRGYDAFAGVIKSGGKTRRAAKMQILDVDHPDILEFIGCKAHEELKARALIERAGYPAELGGEAYESVAFQNLNTSVRVTDDFMVAADLGTMHMLQPRVSSNSTEIAAREVFTAIAKAAWECGDPGMQFHDTINEWHTCPQAGEIVASNPCSEYMFLGETACNLASLNLVKYIEDDGKFDVEKFQADVRTLITAMDNVVDLAGYPTEEIAQQTRKYRALGLGYANLGGALVKLELHYDSPEARDWAEAITALMHFTAYEQSAVLAKQRGTYEGYDAVNHLCIFEKHVEELWLGHESITQLGRIRLAAQYAANDTQVTVEQHGFRNAQVTCLAPTGTISFIMDCVTTGIEPLFARTFVKRLSGGGELVTNVKGGDWVVTADELTPKAHMDMMIAVQPFLSGAISKTVNMPSTAIVEDIEVAYEYAWQHELKSLAIYRDGCKAVQPLNKDAEVVATTDAQVARVVRQSLPDERPAVTHKFSVGGHHGYLTIGMYDDGRPGELFVKIAKEGSTVSGLLDAWAIGVSLALQHGVPLETVMAKHEFARFEPAGMTTCGEIPMAHSLVDYIARWMLIKFAVTPSANFGNEDVDVAYVDAAPTYEASADICPQCGGLMQRTGMCHTCPQCGHNGGCG